MVNIKFQSDASGNISAYDPVGSWQTWTPTLTPQGGMTVTSVTLTIGEYLRAGPIVYFRFQVNATAGGTLSNLIYVSLPPVAYSTSGSMIGALNWQQAQPTAGMLAITTTEFRCYGPSAFVAGTFILSGCGFYRCA